MHRHRMGFRLGGRIELGGKVVVTRFEEVFQRVVGHEGVYSNDSRDPGGETKYGITWKTLRRAIELKIVPAAQTIKDLDLDTARLVYQAIFWKPIAGEELGPPLDEFMFDFAVNSGVNVAALALQRAAGVLLDAWIGPKTLEAVRAKRQRDVLRLVFVDRAMVYARIDKEETYRHGWYGRLFDCTEQALRFSK